MERVMDTVVYSVVTEVVGRLSSLVAREFGLVWGFETELLALHSTFTRIQSVLEDAKVKQGKGKAVDDWLRKLKAAALEMESLLDEVSNAAMVQRGIINRVCGFFTARNPVVFRARMAHRVQKIREKLDAIAADKSMFESDVDGIDNDVGVGDHPSVKITSRL